MIYKDISSAINATTQEIQQAAEQTLQDAGEFAREQAVATTLFKVSDSFKENTQFHATDELNGFVLCDRPWAEYLEYGNNQNGPYIYPVNAKALHFQVGGKDIFVKKVRSHPPLPFMQEAGEKLEANIENIFNKNLEISIKE